MFRPMLNETTTDDGVTWDSVPPKAVRGTNKSIPRTENTGRTDPRGLNKSIPHRVNRSSGDQNSQISNTTIIVFRLIRPDQSEYAISKGTTLNGEIGYFVTPAPKRN